MVILHIHRTIYTFAQLDGIIIFFKDDQLIIIIIPTSSSLINSRPRRVHRRRSNFTLETLAEFYILLSSSSSSTRSVYDEILLYYNLFVLLLLVLLRRRDFVSFRSKESLIRKTFRIMLHVYKIIYKYIYHAPCCNIALSQTNLLSKNVLLVRCALRCIFSPRHPNV